MARFRASNRLPAHASESENLRLLRHVVVFDQQRQHRAPARLRRHRSAVSRQPVVLAQGRRGAGRCRCGDQAAPSVAALRRRIGDTERHGHFAAVFRKAQLLAAAAPPLVRADPRQAQLDGRHRWWWRWWRRLRRRGSATAPVHNAQGEWNRHQSGVMRRRIAHRAAALAFDGKRLRWLGHVVRHHREREERLPRFVRMEPPCRCGQAVVLAGAGGVQAGRRLQAAVSVAAALGRVAEVHRHQHGAIALRQEARAAQAYLRRWRRRDIAIDELNRHRLRQQLEMAWHRISLGAATLARKRQGLGALLHPVREHGKRRRQLPVRCLDPPAGGHVVIVVRGRATDRLQTAIPVGTLARRIL